MNNITLADFQLRINELLVFLQDAHTFVNIEPLSLYPFSVRYFNGSFYLYSISSRYKNVTGKVITSMGGMKLAGMLPAENKIKAGITGSHFLNNPSLIKRLGIDGDVLEIVFSDGDRINIDKENGTNNQPDQMTVIKPNAVTARQPMPYHYRMSSSCGRSSIPATAQRQCTIIASLIPSAIFNSMKCLIVILINWAVSYPVKHRMRI